MATPNKQQQPKGGKQSKAAAAPAAVDDEKDEGVVAPNEVADEKANDAATGLNAGGDAGAAVDADGNPIELVRYGFDILANIKQAQLQNGLRHGDYMRYRVGSTASHPQLVASRL